MVAYRGCMKAGTGAKAGRATWQVVRDRLARCDRSTRWRLVHQIPLAFDTFHPQGMVVVDDRIFVSSVEILEPTRRLVEPVDGRDRTAGAGIGHLFVVDQAGSLVADLVVGEGDCYHPGGIDYDGAAIWVPVAEYRPNSRAVIYRVGIESLTVERRFEVSDHIGGLLCDVETNSLAGHSWASRRFYRWTEDGSMLLSRANPSHFVDYQDGQYLADGVALCSGIAELPVPSGQSGWYELGGLALVDVREVQVRHEWPLSLWSPAGHVLTRNPVWAEATQTGIRLYAAPDDSGERAGTTIFVLEADLE